MPVEIERRFLVVGDAWRQGGGVRICQGYLNRDPKRTVRVRLAGNEAALTVKGLTCGATRGEYEYALPVQDAKELLKLCDGPVIEKVRYRVPYAGLTWEVDEFLGDNRGLVLAEVELAKEDQPFERPAWLGQEVTPDYRYCNSNLSAHPYCNWSDESGSAPANHSGGKIQNKATDDGQRAARLELIRQALKDKAPRMYEDLDSSGGLQVFLEGHDEEMMAAFEKEKARVWEETKTAFLNFADASFDESSQPMG